MCHSNSEMYEGKNIHYSSYDKKPLCSFSGKVCNQHRLNGYAFCVRHILEDPTAPFKRCAYVAKSSKQTCTQAIPQHEDRKYCNNHMQVLGMLPKKERKPKKEKMEHSVILPSPTDIKLPFEDRVKSRFNSKLRNNDVILKGSGGLDDPDDPYAFPDPSGDASSGSKVTTPSSGLFPASPLDTSTSIVKSPSDSGVSSIAKLYPELAEKLEKIKPKQEIKTKEKGKSKSSRTMNQLQTRIAQNKIKDKQKRVQDSSSTSQSPSHFGNLINSPKMNSPGMLGNQIEERLSNNRDTNLQHRDLSSSGIIPDFHHTFSEFAKGNEIHNVQESVTHQSDRTAVSGHKELQQTRKSEELVSPQEFRKRPELSSNSNQEIKRSSLPSFSDLQQRLSQGLQMETLSASRTNMLPGMIPGLPQSGLAGLPGLLPNVTPEMLQALSTGTLPMLPDALFSLGSHLSGQQSQQPKSNMSDQKPAQIPSGLPLQNLSQASLSGLYHRLLDQNILSQRQALLDQGPKVQLPQPTKVSSTSSTTVPMETQPIRQSHSRHFPVMPEPPPYRQLTPHSTPPSTMPVVSTSTFTTPSVTVTSSSHQVQGLPPPPPYAPTSTTATQSTIPSVLPTKTKSSRSITVPTFSVISNVLLPVTRTPVRKIKNVLNDQDAHKRLRIDSSVSYYNHCLKRKKHNHSLLGLGLSSSEDSSESDDDSFLPWQPEWFTASSDEDNFDDEDDDQDDALRTAKVALVRARLRRQCFQSRKSHRANNSQYRINNSATDALIKAARDQPQAAVRALHEILQRQPPPVDRYKVKGFEKRQCCYKNDEEVQCKNPVLPCTNHCLKHIMYNVDQQLFDYCTAKFADNTQCCVPVFDFKHELPLCVEHGKKADNYNKSQETEIKPKRQRKKTKPSALTRPPKKGKKKKNQRRTIRPQKPSPPSMPIGLTDMPPLLPTASTDEPETGANDKISTAEKSPESPDIKQPEIAVKPQTTSASAPPVVSIPPVTTVAQSAPTSSTADLPKDLTEKSSLSEIPDHVLEANFAPDMDRALGLPLEQASKLLEEQDFTDVFNKIPDDFDLFSGKNGEFLPTKEEVEELERSLAAANNEVRSAQQSLENLSQAEKDLIENEEQLKEMATLLSQSLNGNGNMSGEMCNGLPENVNQENISAAVNRNIPSSDVSVLQRSASSVEPTNNRYSFIGQPGTVLSNVQVGTVTQTNTSLTVTVNSAASNFNSHPVLQHQNVFTTQHPVQQRFLTTQNSLPAGFHGAHVLPGQQFVQPAQPPSSQSNIPIQQLVTAAGAAGLTGVRNLAVDGRLTVDNIQGNIPTLTKSHSVPGTQLQTSIPITHVTWPGNLGNIVTFQNGFPLTNATFVHTGTETTQGNIKFGLNMNLNTNEIKELAQFQTPAHSSTTGVVRAPHPGLTNSQPLPVYQGPPPYKASSGNGS